MMCSRTNMASVYLTPILVTIIICIGITKDVSCLRDVRLSVTPLIVKRGEEAVLECLYDLEAAPLYSVKMYRGYHEFYRFSPNHTPTNKAFPLPGVEVDLIRSNANRAVVYSVGFHFSGNITCEVTTDAPDFLTAAASRDIMVVELPETGPVLKTEKDRYEVGQILRANCSSLPSRPAASLSFLLNNLPVNASSTRFYKKDEWRNSSRISLDLPLKLSHFAQGHLDLKCTALVGEYYLDTRTLHLGVKDSDPIPERVTSRSSKADTIILPILIALGTITYSILRIS